MSASIIKLTAEKPSHLLNTLDYQAMAQERVLLDTSTLLESGSLLVGDDSAKNCHELAGFLWPDIYNRRPKLLFMNITHSNGPFGVFLKSSSHTCKYIKFRNSFEEAEDSECLIVNSYAFREHGPRITLLAEAETVDRQVRSIRFTVVSFPYFNNAPFDDDDKLNDQKNEDDKDDKDDEDDNDDKDDKDDNDDKDGNDDNDDNDGKDGKDGNDR